MAERSFYDILGVSKSATEDEIRAAYRKLARKLHPDVNKATDAAAKFNEVQEAYDTLSDAARRKSYDRYGRGGAPTTSPGSGGASRGHYSWRGVGTPGGTPTDFDVEDLGSIFESFFSGRGGARDDAFADAMHRARRDTRRGAQRASHAREVQADLDVSFITAAKGGTETVRLREGDSTRTVDVAVPAGIEDGSQIRVKGAGRGTGSSAGDLVLTVRVGKHPLFRRGLTSDGRGLDLYLDLPLTIAEATLGARVRVPTLTGTVELSIPPGTPSGKTLRLRGCGITSDAGAKGDLYAVTRMISPDGRILDDADRAALERIASLGPRLRIGPEWPG